MPKPPKDPSEYAVGYRKPPLDTRFKPGASGNPRGRAKGHANLRTDLDAELKERIRFTENGKTHFITAQRAMVKVNLRNACKGDVRAFREIINLMARIYGLGDDPEIDAEKLSAGDAEILAMIMADKAPSGRDDDD